ncbi:L-threonylcarbamoyladenylate synthase [Chthonomonas calidirosea]|uniref:L-threonylcarbamoyladenylate synthase n=1 Tax=Chthonomonas calidirosea TaxID=454171 RepID=UPI0006ECA3F8|nr:L-threonylcarbamoyladenylate synthase [Chthonomonas calidirosea]CEK17081.1 translation factor SUA5 [Chthonomonas calidirosea]
MIETKCVPATPEAIAEAAARIRSGELVAFPTETVYGLGAHALNPQAVAAIFTAKGRPATNPLIVHVLDIEAARSLVTTWPAHAQRLAERFWPGPLTLVLPKNASVPDEVTGGGPTVGLRAPSHPVARALLEAARVPIAAPSANRSNHVSPTTAQHVWDDLKGRIALILDGGPTQGGLESTVLSLTEDPPRILRLGLIPPAAIEAVVGPIRLPSLSSAQAEQEGTPLPSPGMLRRHYAPKVPLEIAENAAARVQELLAQGERVGWLALQVPGRWSENAVVIKMPASAEAYAQRLYAALRELEAEAVTRIVVDAPPQTQEWLAIWDRLRRAAA